MKDVSGADTDWSRCVRSGEVCQLVRGIPGIVIELDSALRDTPYLVSSGDAHRNSFRRTALRSADVAARALEATRRIGQEADALLKPFLRARRSDLVAESNQIEGYDVSRKQVMEAVAAHEELMHGDVHNLMQAMRADPKIVTKLGLYRAQELADEWASSSDRPRAHELRQLHTLLLADERHGGRYRTRDVAIGGTDFRPPPHFDVPRAMDQFSDWWSESTGDPVLDATVSHAWLTHIHPYEDGNGRLARLMANFALAQSHYPPLVVRADRDRGQYYDALSISDTGDILPLYELFASVIRRTVKEMSAANYTRDFLEDRLLASIDEQRAAWTMLLDIFLGELEGSLDSYGWKLDRQGRPDRTAFALLADRDLDGNGWCAKVRNEAGKSRYLLWFGYNTTSLLDLLGVSRTGYPSIFVSRRDLRGGAVHPYVNEAIDGVFDEIFLRPLQSSSAVLRSNYETKSGTPAHVSKRVANQLLVASA